MNILDENTDFDGGALVTSAAMDKLKRATNTSVVLAVFIGLNTAFGILSNLGQIYTHFFNDFGTGLPTFYKWINFYHLFLNSCQVVVFVMLLQFIGKARKFTSSNPPYSGEKTFEALNSLFVWMAVNGVLLFISFVLYRIGSLFGN